MFKKFIHIGMGRSANITLINEIYPLIDKYTDYEFFVFNKNIHDQININYERMKRGKEIKKKIDIQQNLIVSDERLISWNPYNWEVFADSNLKMFGRDASILITLRKPFDYLNSMYTKQCLVHGNLMTPNEYFALKNEYNEEDEKIFYIENFSYQKLKKIYKDRFEKVYFLDYENLGKMDFFENYFQLSSDKKEILKSKFSNIRHNPSFKSKYTSNLTLVIYYFLKIPAYLFNFEFLRNQFKKLKIFSVKRKIKDQIFLDSTIQNIHLMSTNDIKLNFYSSLINLFKWPKLMFFLEKKFNFKKKFNINLSNKKKLIIEKCEKEYLDILSEKNN